MYRSAVVSTPAKRTRYAPKAQLRNKKRNVKRPTLVRLGRQPLPNQITNTLRYCETVTLSLTTGGMQSYFFSCNGLFDPNITGTGHQPLYFDQMITLYDHYTVLRSRCKWTITPPSTPDMILTCAVSIEDDVTIGVTNPGFIAERQTGQIQVFNPKSSNAQPRYFYQSWDAAKTFGGNPKSDPNMQGNYNSNPTEQSYFQISIFEGNLNSVAIPVTIEIEYDVAFDELTSVASS